MAKTKKTKTESKPSAKSKKQEVALDKEIVSKAKYLRISPIKLRRVADLVRGKGTIEAGHILKSVPHKGAGILEKVLKSAVANAVHNNKLDENTLTINTLLVNEGPRLKRFQPRARGRVFQILKRTSHVHLGLTIQGEQ